MSLVTDAQQIKNETQDGLNTATRVGGLLEKIVTTTGWGNYADNQYTELSPFSVSADTVALLPNNKGDVIETQKPYDIDTFYDGTTIKGRNGDGILVTVDFLVKPTSASTTYIEIWVDITGGTGVPDSFANLYKRPISFPKGTGVERPVNFTFGGYTLGTWETNGGVIKVLGNGSFDIYDIRYVITRTHKAI